MITCGSKYKDRKTKKENAGSMEAWSYAQYAGATERERERHTHTHTKTLLQNSNSMLNVHVCVFNAHVLYMSLQGLTEVLSYFNDL